MSHHDPHGQPPPPMHNDLDWLEEVRENPCSRRGRDPRCNRRTVGYVVPHLEAQHCTLWRHHAYGYPMLLLVDMCTLRALLYLSDTADRNALASARYLARNPDDPNNVRESPAGKYGRKNSRRSPSRGGGLPDDSGRWRTVGRGRPWRIPSRSASERAPGKHRRPGGDLSPARHCRWDELGGNYVSSAPVVRCNRFDGDRGPDESRFHLLRGANALGAGDSCSCHRPMASSSSRLALRRAAIARQLSNPRCLTLVITRFCHHDRAVHPAPTTPLVGTAALEESARLTPFEPRHTPPPVPGKPDVIGRG